MSNPSAPLPAGTRIGAYEIVAPIGRGGMGEVYRARDARLQRDVAIKVLPDAFAADGDRLARFAREAQTLAALNHPNIAAIYGIEESGHSPALVMELVEGEDLSAIIARQRQGAPAVSGGGAPRALDIDDAIAIARQIASALEAAHEQGIIHRDLKPANVKVRDDGTVKVLDFGLAKAVEGTEADGGRGDLANSPTLTNRATQLGMILGTAAYMSPEQAKGRSVDKRADIWAFGCVLYEMLTGVRAFKGDDISDTLASVLKDPPPIDTLPSNTPPSLKRLVERCLQRDVRLRLRDIGEARIALEDAAMTSDVRTSVPEPSRPAVPPSASRWRWLAIGGVAGALAATAAVSLWPRPVASTPAVRFSIALPAPPPAFSSGAHLAISPDGRRVAVSLVDSTGRRLYGRATDELELTPIRGTELAVAPFFSPNGEYLAFFAESKLKKVPIGGGSADTICLCDGVSGYWGANDDIVVQTAFRSPLSHVPAAGGELKPLTTLQPGELGHSSPQWLPDGKTLLFTIISIEGSRLVASTPESSERTVIVNAGESGRYLKTGYVTYLDTRSGVLMAAPFSAASLKVTGQPIRIAEGIARSPTTVLVDYDASLTGDIAFLPGSAAIHRSFAWVTRDGITRTLPIKPQSSEQPRLSKDGKRLIARVGTGAGEQTDLWAFDLERGTPLRLTFEPQESETALWTDDGARILFAGSRTGKPRAVYAKASDAGGPETTIATTEHLVHLTSLSPDGKTVALTQFPAGTGDILILDDPFSGKAKLRPFIQTPFNEYGAVFSPDGHWLAYTSNESGGADQVFVQAYPGPGGKFQISTDGGTEPVWARNGRELYFRYDDKMMAVPVSFAPTFRPGTPVMIFEGRFERAHRSDANYDVTPDGRFLMIKADQQATPRFINVLMNLPELRAK